MSIKSSDFIRAINNHFQSENFLKFYERGIETLSFKLWTFKGYYCLLDKDYGNFISFYKRPDREFNFPPGVWGFENIISRLWFELYLEGEID